MINVIFLGVWYQPWLAGITLILPYTSSNTIYKNMTITTTVKPKAIKFIYELERELNNYNKNKETLTFFKAALHAMRDKLNNRDAMLLLSGLPPYLKPIFWEGWKPSQCCVLKESFIELVGKYSTTYGNSFIKEKEIEKSVKKVFWMIENKLTPENKLKVKSCLPDEIRKFI